MRGSRKICIGGLVREVGVGSSKDRSRRRGEARTPRRLPEPAGRVRAPRVPSSRWAMRNVLLALTLVLLPAGARAQAPSNFVPDTGAVIATAPHWAGEFAILSGNAVLSGVTAGVVQKLRGGSFRDGFVRGLTGGGVIYLGKRVAAERFSGAGLLGREVASLGTSMVRNASEGYGLLDDVVLPVGAAPPWQAPPWQRSR